MGINTGIQRLLDLLKNDTDQRAALTTLENADFNEANNSVVTVISSTNNTNGVIIREANVSSNGSRATINVSGNRLIEANGSGQFAIKDVFVPAGFDITLVSTQSDSFATSWTETLS